MSEQDPIANTSESEREWIAHRLRAIGRRLNQEFKDALSPESSDAHQALETCFEYIEDPQAGAIVALCDAVLNDVFNETAEDSISGKKIREIITREWFEQVKNGNAA